MNNLNNLMINKDFWQSSQINKMVAVNINLKDLKIYLTKIFLETNIVKILIVLVAYDDR